MIDGNGAVISNGSDPDCPVSGEGFVVGSSDFILQDVVVRRMAKPFEMRPADAGGQSRVVIRGSTFEDGGPSIRATAADGSPAVLRDVQFIDNRVRGPLATGRPHPLTFNQALGVTGAGTPFAGELGTAIPETAIDGIVLRGNDIRGFGSGVSLIAASSGAGRMANGHIRNLTFEKNYVEIPAEGGDPAPMLWGAALLGGDVRDSGMSNIRIVDNELISPGMPVYMTTVEVVFFQRTKRQRTKHRHRRTGFHRQYSEGRGRPLRSRRPVVGRFHRIRHGHGARQHPAQCRFF